MRLCKILFLIFIWQTTLVYSVKAFDPAVQKRFSDALYLQQNGDLIEAELLFKSILSEYPRLNRVRLELARNLFLQGSLNESEKYFLLALRQDVPEAVAENIYFFLREIKNLKPTEFDFGISVMPGFANEYKQTSDYVYVDAFGAPLPFKIQEAEQKGNGVNALTNAKFKHPIDNQKRLIFSLGAAFEVFEKSKFNKSSLSLSQRTEYLSDDSLYFIGPISNVEWEENNLKLKNYGLNIGGVIPITRKLTVFPDSLILKQDGYGRRFEHDGYIFEIGLRLNLHSGNGASLFFKPVAKHFQHDRDETETFDEMRLTVGYESLNWNSLESDIAISWSNTSFYKKSGFFTHKRIDEVKSINWALFDKKLRLFDNFYGGVRLIFEKSASTLGLYDFENLITRIEAKRKF